MNCIFCEYNSCLKCSSEAHRPLKCVLYGEWSEIISGKSEKTDIMWIKANSKICPGCFDPIIKDQGCMHMTCRCGHGFCWLCLGPWKEHGDETGGYYNCNNYKSEIHDKEQNTAKAKMKKY